MTISEEAKAAMGGREYILTQLLQEWTALFIAKNKDYNDTAGFEPHRVLGIKGQFADIWRKVFKLKKHLWDGDSLAFEQPREVLMDLIGHCFLTMEMIDRGGDLDRPLIVGPGKVYQGPDILNSPGQDAPDLASEQRKRDVWRAGLS